MEKFTITKEQAMQLWKHFCTHITLEDIIQKDPTSFIYNIKISNNVNLVIEKHINNFEERQLSIVFNNYIVYTIFKITNDEFNECIEILEKCEQNLRLIQKTDDIEKGVEILKNFLGDENK